VAEICDLTNIQKYGINCATLERSSALRARLVREARIMVLAINSFLAVLALILLVELLGIKGQLAVGRVSA
jgi:hypothetical protein